MDFSALDQFNAQISNYAQTIGLDTGDIESTLNDKIEALKQKGQDLLEGLVPAEALIANPGGLGLTELATAGESLLQTVGVGSDVVASAVGSGVVSAVQGIAKGVRAAKTAYAGIKENLTNPKASRLEGEIDPEFGVSDESVMNALNTGLARAPASSSFIPRSAAGGDLADMSAMRAPIYGSDVARIADAPEAINTVVPVANAEGALVPAEDIAINLGRGAVSEGVASAAASAETVASTGVAGALETVGAGADATGIGAVLGIPLQIIGLALGGYSLFHGIEDMFSSHHSPDVASLLPNIALPQFQAA
jgi:hypothetical protein